jgi:diaminopimelate epimerase
MPVSYSPVPFLKMQSLGNDFIILDSRKSITPLERFDFSALANRRTGIGCDQIIWLHPTAEADIAMRIINADGSEVEACGNATRCIGWLMMQEMESLQCRIQTQAGILHCSRDSLHSRFIAAQMGVPQYQQTNYEGNPLIVQLGNPHLVFQTQDVAKVALDTLGAYWENHPDFPHRTNVEFVERISDSHLKMRVWERGVGITQACGTGACASAVMAISAGWTGHDVTVEMPGGSLKIHWAGGAEDAVTMTGAVQLSFEGNFESQAYQMVI